MAAGMSTSLLSRYFSIRAQTAQAQRILAEGARELNGMKKIQGKKKSWTAAIFAAMMWVLLPSPLRAAISLALAITPSSITFPDANPTTVPVVSANASVTVNVNVSKSVGNAWSVHGLAAGNLSNTVGGTSTIPIFNVSWTATQVSKNCGGGCSCLAGTMSKNSPQNLITGRGDTPGSGFQCLTNFSLVNRWSYNTGSYTQTFTITATSP